jgi:hypothetical protein
VTDDVSTDLARYVNKYIPGSAYHKIAESLIRARQIPTLEKVKERHEVRLAAKLRQRARHMERIDPVQITDDLIKEMGQIISYSWSRRGHCPLWSEVREAMEWDRDQTVELLHRLRQAGTITFTTDRGSLALPEANS